MLASACRSVGIGVTGHPINGHQRGGSVFAKKGRDCSAKGHDRLWPVIRRQPPDLPQQRRKRPESNGRWQAGDAGRRVATRRVLVPQ